MHYYTYAYLREDKTPYYIGKGKGNRLYKKGSRVFAPPKDKSRIIFLKKNLTEEEAFRHEIYMIAVLGRKDLGTGILHNKTDGGEGASGRITNEETKRNMSEAGKGKSLSDETRKRISEANKNPSEETRKRMSEASKNRSEETKIKISESSKGKNRSEEHKRNISEANKGRNKGKKWWNDSCGNCKMMVECPGDGWKPGRK